MRNIDLMRLAKYHFLDRKDNNIVSLHGAWSQARNNPNKQACASFELYAAEGICVECRIHISVSAIVHIASLSRDNNGARDQARALGSISAKQADMLCVGDERNR